METNNQAVENNTVQTTQQKAVKQYERNNYEFGIKCAIRRRPDLPKGIPGESPLARTYKLSAGLTRNGGPVKGVEGLVEKKIMPMVVSVTPAEPDFFNKVNNYWNDIGVEIPADESSLGKEKGKSIQFKVYVNRDLRDKLKESESIEEQVRLIIKGIEQDRADIDYDNVHSFLLLAFALKRNNVANTINDIYKSNKITFYIHDEKIYVKSQMNLIEKINEASKLFTTVTLDDVKVKSLLTLLKVDLTELDSAEERIIALHKTYSTPENVDAFLKYVKDADIMYRYLIETACVQNKLKRQPNTGWIFYNDILLGKSTDDVVAYFKADDKETKEIFRQIQNELEIFIEK